MPKLRSITTLLALLGSWAPLHAQDLLTVYELALENDAQLQIAEANYLAAIEALPQARSGRKPQVFFNADATVVESDNSRLGDDSSDSVGYGVSLSQALYDTETRGNVLSAEASTRAELARLQSVRQAVALRVAEAYFAILAAHDNVDFAYAERTAIERQLEQAQKRFEVGLIAITDVQEAKARFDSAEAQAILAENILENAYQALVVITGDPSVRNLWRLESQLALTLPDPADANAWVEVALQNNRDLIAAREDLNAARFERDKRNRRGYPTLDLVASYEDRDTDSDLLGDTQQEDVTVGIQLEIPLYTGGRISSEQAEAEAQLVSAQNNTLLQTRLASQRSRIAYLDVVSGISQVSALEQALESSNVALEATQAGFEVGTRTSVDVLVSLRETYRAQRDYASSRYEFLLNKLRLKQAAGTLAQEDLSEINRRLIRP
ncbi:MAG TPA: TolC family outer membrane protein [Gammaproteobacteria bacterium]